MRHLGGAEFKVFSAGLETHGVNPKAVQVMAEVGLDISDHTSELLENYIDQDFDLMVTVCGDARESCPAFVGKVKHRQHWPFNDPAKATGTKEEVLAAFRQVRDEIRDRIIDFLKEN